LAEEHDNDEDDDIGEGVEDEDDESDEGYERAYGEDVATASAAAEAIALATAGEGGANDSGDKGKGKGDTEVVDLLRVQLRGPGRLLAQRSIAVAAFRRALIDAAPSSGSDDQRTSQRNGHPSSLLRIARVHHFSFPSADLGAISSSFTRNAQMNLHVAESVRCLPSAAHPPSSEPPDARAARPLLNFDAFPCISLS